MATGAVPLQRETSSGGVSPPTPSSPRRSEAPLFAEDFLYVTDLLLHFASDLFVGAAISQVRIADCFPGLLFGFAFGFAQTAFDLIFCARSHTSDSLRAACPSGYFGEREITHAFGSGQKGPSAAN